MLDGRARKRVEDPQEVAKAFPPGTRVRWLQDGSVWVIGVRYGTRQFWMMQEGGRAREKVDAATVLEEYERVKE